VAEAAGMTLERIAELGDENLAMTKMAEGAVKLTLERYRRGQSTASSRWAARWAPTWRST